MEIANRKSDNSDPLLQLLQHGCMLEILTCMIVWAEECVVLEALRRGFEDCFGCLQVLDLNEIAMQDRAWCGSWSLVINAVRPDSFALSSA